MDVVQKLRSKIFGKTATILCLHDLKLYFLSIHSFNSHRSYLWGFNITVGVANWALLAGYLVIPGTFTSLQTSNQVERVLQANKAGRTVLHTIQNLPLLGIACLLLVSGIGALMWLLHFPKARATTYG
jgi:hypothetical protein